MAAGTGRIDTHVSVVAPLYNESASIDRLLACLARQSGQPAEVVLVDAGSTDDTAERAARFRGPFVLSLVRTGRLNPGEARNEGVRQARQGWIAFVDGGTYPDAAWLQELIDASAGADVVFGAYEPACDTFFRRCAALAYVPPRDETGVRGAFVASMALRRSVFDTVGGFPPYRAAEDLVFIERIRAGGFRVAYAPKAVVWWDTAPDVTSTFRRFALYSRVNLEAGRGRFWHRGLARQYAAVAALLVAGFAAGLGAWTWGLVPTWLLARTIRAAWRKRGDLPFPTLRPDYVAGAAVLLAVVDAATWTGAARWLLGGRRVQS